MSEYSIQETTLIGIGDALRRRHGDTKIIIVQDYLPLKIISKTENATGFESWEGYYPYTPGTYVYDVVKIEGASKISVKMTYETDNDTTLWDGVQIAVGDYNTSGTSIFNNTTRYYSKSTLEMVELEFENTDTISFRFRGQGESDRNHLGYYAECRGYDADGNLILTDEIGDVEKEVPNKYSSAEFANAINSISLKSFVPEEKMTLSGDCKYMFKNGSWDWFVNDLGEDITTKFITDTSYMFQDSYLERIPFTINLTLSEGSDCKNMFEYCSLLKELPDMTGAIKRTDYLMRGCKMVRHIPESWADLDFSWSNSQSSSFYSNFSATFDGCFSLREIPEALLKKMWNKSTSSSFSYMFSNCIALDEIVGFRGANAVLTSNGFTYVFDNVERAKRLVFDMENGSPRVEQWKNQTIDLSKYFGYSATVANAYVYNSGITEDKEVKDDATYQALKNNPDWFTINVAYSRYNHNSAVETINSLPNCSSSGGTNTIKFKGEAGSLTDGGAINTMTEEEIAVATVKGWTVSFV